MSKRRRPPAPDAQAQLDELYASLPSIECRGKCWDSCGSIGMTRPEQQRIRDRHGVTLPLMAAYGQQARCPALTMLGRCGVYDSRPLVCRLWGLVPSMRCNYGCVPTGGLLTEREGFLLLARASEIAGDHAAAAAVRARWEDLDTAKDTERWIRQREEQRQIDWEVRHNRAVRDGSAVYVTASGALTRDRTEQASGGFRH